MFLCDRCSKDIDAIRYSLLDSYGRCEHCGRQDVCYDVQFSAEVEPDERRDRSGDQDSDG